VDADGGPRSTVTAELMPGTLDVEHLRERFYDPAAHVAPPALDDVSHDAPHPASLDDMRQQGGPLLEELRQAVVSAFSAGEAASIGDAFNGLHANLRRPVEILGMLQMATQIDAVHGAEAVEIFETVRPGGSQQRFSVPRITLTEHKTAALAALNSGSDDD